MHDESTHLLHACKTNESTHVLHAENSIAIDLPMASVAQQSAMCYLLTALVAFSEGTHGAIVSAGLVPQLVALCRPKCLIGGHVSAMPS